MAISNIVAIKRYFEQADDIAPQGGRKVEMAELIEAKGGLKKEDKAELGGLCAVELGIELD